LQPGFSFVLRIPHAINEINHFGNWRFNWLTAKVEAMEKRTEEWLRQSDYDFETAEAMGNPEGTGGSFWGRTKTNY
jgi:hypothetical protein